MAQKTQDPQEAARRAVQPVLDTGDRLGPKLPPMIPQGPAAQQNPGDVARITAEALTKLHQHAAGLERRLPPDPGAMKGVFESLKNVRIEYNDPEGQRASVSLAPLIKRAEDLNQRAEQNPADSKSLADLRVVGTAIQRIVDAKQSADEAEGRGHTEVANVVKGEIAGSLRLADQGREDRIDAVGFTASKFLSNLPALLSRGGTQTQGPLNEEGAQVLATLRRLSDPNIDVPREEVSTLTRSVDALVSTAVTRYENFSARMAEILAQMQSMMSPEKLSAKLKEDMQKLKDEIEKLASSIGKSKEEEAKREGEIAKLEEKLKDVFSKILEELKAPAELVDAVRNASGMLKKASKAAKEDAELLRERANQIVKLGLTFIRNRVFLNDPANKQVLERFKATAKMLSDQKLKPAMELVKRSVSEIQNDIERVKRGVAERIADVKKGIAAIDKQIAGLTKAIEGITDKQYRESMQKLLGSMSNIKKSMEDILKRLQSPQRDNPVTTDQLRSLRDAFGYLQLALKKLGDMPDKQEGERKEKGDLASMFANAVNSALKDSRSEMTKTFQFMAQEFQLATDSAYKKTLGALSNSLSEGTKKIEEIKNELCARLLGEAGSALANIKDNLKDSGLAAAFRRLFPDAMKDKPESVSIETLLKARLALSVADYTRKNIQPEKDDAVRKGALGFIKRAYEAIAAGKDESAAKQVQMAAKFIKSPEEREGLLKASGAEGEAVEQGVRKDEATKLSVRAWAKDSADMRSKQDISEEYRASLDKLSKDAKALGERLGRGDEVDEREISALGARMKFAQQMEKELGTLEENERSAASRLYSRALDCMAKGDMAGAAVQAFLGKAYIESFAMRKQMEEFSSKLEKSEMGVAEVIKGLGAYLGGLVEKSASLKAVKDPAIQNAVASLIGKARGENATLDDMEALKTVRTLVDKCAKGVPKIKSADDKETATSIFRRAINGLVLGMPQQYVDDQTALADAYTDPKSAHAEESEIAAKRNQVANVSKSLEEAAYLSMIDTKVNAEPQPGRRAPTAEEAAKSLFGNTPEGIKQAEAYVKLYNSLGEEQKAKSEALTKKIGIARSYVQLNKDASELWDLAKSGGKKYGKDSYEVTIYLSGMDILETAMAKFAKGEAPTPVEMKAAEGVRTAYSGNLDDFASFLSSSPQEAAGLRDRLDGMKNIKDMIKGLDPDSRYRVMLMIGHAQDALAKGKPAEFMAHMIGASAYAKAKTPQEQDDIINVSFALNKGAITADKAIWIERVQLDRVTAVDGIRDPKLKLNVNAYFDLALLAYERKDAIGAEAAYKAANIYAMAAKGDQKDPDAIAAMGLVHKLLGDYRGNREFARHRIRDMSLPEKDRSRWVPADGTLSGVLGKALSSGASFSSELEKAVALDSDKGTAYGDILSLPAATRLGALSAKSTVLSAKLARVDHEKKRLEIVGKNEKVSAKIDYVYQTQSKYHSAKADAAEKKGDETEAARQREEAESIDSGYLETRLDRADAIYDQGIKLMEQAEKLKLQALGEEGDAAKATLQRAFQLDGRGRQLIELAQGAQRSLRGLHDSVMNVRTVNREFGRWRYRDSAESLLSTAEEMAKADVAELDARQSVRVTMAGRNIAVADGQQAKEKEIWKQVISQLGAIKKIEEKVEENEKKYGDVKSTAPTFTTESGIVVGKDTKLVATETRRKQVQYAKGAALSQHFRASNYFLSRAREGANVDLAAVSIELTYRDLMQTATDAERKDGFFKPRTLQIISYESDERGIPVGMVSVGFDYKKLMGAVADANNHLAGGRVNEARDSMEGINDKIRFGEKTQRLMNKSNRDDEAIGFVDDMGKRADNFGKDVIKARYDDNDKQVTEQNAKIEAAKAKRKEISDQIMALNRGDAEAIEKIKSQGKKVYEVKNELYAQLSAASKQQSEAEDKILELKRAREKTDRDKEVVDAIHSTGGPAALAKNARGLKGDLELDKIRVEGELQRLANQSLKGGGEEVIGPSHMNMILDAAFQVSGWDPKYYSGLVAEGKGTQAYQEFLTKNPKLALQALDKMKENGIISDDQYKYAKVDMQSDQVFSRTDNFYRGYQLAMGSFAMGQKMLTTTDSTERNEGWGGGKGPWYMNLRDNAAQVLQFGLAAAASPETISDTIRNGDRVYVNGFRVKIREGGPGNPESWLNPSTKHELPVTLLYDGVNGFLENIQRLSVGHASSANDNFDRIAKGQAPILNHKEATSLTNTVVRGIMARGGLAYLGHGRFDKVSLSKDEQKAVNELTFGRDMGGGITKGGYDEAFDRFVNTGLSLSAIWSYGNRKTMFALVGDQAEEINKGVQKIVDNRRMGFPPASKEELDRNVMAVIGKRDTFVASYDAEEKTGRRNESYGRAGTAIFKIAGAGLLMATGLGAVVGVGFGVEAIHDLAESSRRAGGWSYLSTTEQVMGVGNIVLSFGGAALGEISAVANESLAVARASAQEATAFASASVRAGTMTALDAAKFTQEVGQLSKLGTFTNAFSQAGMGTRIVGGTMMAGGLIIAGHGFYQSYEAYKKGDMTLAEFIVSGPVGLLQAGVPVVGAHVLPTKFSSLWQSEGIGGKIFRGSMLFLTGETKGAMEAHSFAAMQERYHNEFQKLPEAQRAAIFEVEKTLGRSLSAEQGIEVLNMMPAVRKENGELVSFKPMDAEALARFKADANLHLEAAPRMEAMRDAYTDFKAGKLDSKRMDELRLSDKERALFEKEGALAKAPDQKAADKAIANHAAFEARVNQLDRAASDAGGMASPKAAKRAGELAEAYKLYLRGGLNEESLAKYNIGEPELRLFKRISEGVPENVPKGIVAQAEGEIVQKERMSIKDKAEKARAMSARRDLLGEYKVEIGPEGHFFTHEGNRYSQQHAEAAADVATAADALAKRAKRGIEITTEDARGALENVSPPGAAITKEKIAAAIELARSGEFDTQPKSVQIERALGATMELPEVKPVRETVVKSVAKEAGTLTADPNATAAQLQAGSKEQAKLSERAKRRASALDEQAKGLKENDPELANLRNSAERERFKAEAYEANSKALEAEAGKRAKAESAKADERLGKAIDEEIAKAGGRIPKDDVTERAGKMKEAYDLDQAGKLTEADAQRLGFKNLVEAKAFLAEVERSPQGAMEKIAQRAAAEQKAALDTTPPIDIREVEARVKADTANLEPKAGAEAVEKAKKLTAAYEAWRRGVPAPEIMDRFGLKEGEMSYLQVRVGLEPSEIVADISRLAARPDLILSGEVGNRVGELSTLAVSGNKSKFVEQTIEYLGRMYGGKEKIPPELIPREGATLYDTIKNAAPAMKKLLEGVRRELGYEENIYDGFAKLNGDVAVGADLLGSLAANPRVSKEAQPIGVIVFDGAKTWMKNGLGYGGEKFQSHDRTYMGFEVGDLGLKIYMEAGNRFKTKHPEIYTKLQTAEGDEVVSVIRGDKLGKTPAEAEAAIAKYKQSFLDTLKEVALGMGLDEKSPLFKAMTDVNAHGGVVTVKPAEKGRSFSFGGKEYGDLNGALVALEVSHSLHSLEGREGGKASAVKIDRFIGDVLGSKAGAEPVPIAIARQREGRDIQPNAYATFRVGFEGGFRGDVQRLAENNGKGVTHIQNGLAGPSVMNQLGHPVTDKLTAHFQDAMVEAFKAHGIADKVKIYADGPMTFAFEFKGPVDMKTFHAAVAEAGAKFPQRMKENGMPQIEKATVASAAVEPAKNMTGTVWERAPDGSLRQRGLNPEEQARAAIKKAKDEVKAPIVGEMFQYRAVSRGAENRLNAIIADAHLYYRSTDKGVVPEYSERSVLRDVFTDKATGQLMVDESVMGALEKVAAKKWIRTAEDLINHLRASKVSEANIDKFFSVVGFEHVKAEQMPKGGAGAALRIKESAAEQIALDQTGTGGPVPRAPAQKPALEPAGAQRIQEDTARNLLETAKLPGIVPDKAAVVTEDGKRFIEIPYETEYRSETIRIPAPEPVPGQSPAEFKAAAEAHIRQQIEEKVRPFQKLRQQIHMEGLAAGGPERRSPDLEARFNASGLGEAQKRVGELLDQIVKGIEGKKDPAEFNQKLRDAVAKYPEYAGAVNDILTSPAKDRASRLEKLAEQSKAIVARRIANENLAPGAGRQARDLVALDHGVLAREPSAGEKAALGKMKEDIRYISAMKDGDLSTAIKIAEEYARTVKAPPEGGPLPKAEQQAKPAEPQPMPAQAGPEYISPSRFAKTVSEFQRYNEVYNALSDGRVSLNRNDPIPGVELNSQLGKEIQEIRLRVARGENLDTAMKNVLIAKGPAGIEIQAMRVRVKAGDSPAAAAAKVLQQSPPQTPEQIGIAGGRIYDFAAKRAVGYDTTTEWNALSPAERDAANVLSSVIGGLDKPSALALSEKLGRAVERQNLGERKGSLSQAELERMNSLSELAVRMAKAEKANDPAAFNKAAGELAGKNVSGEEGLAFGNFLSRARSAPDTPPISHVDNYLSSRGIEKPKAAPPPEFSLGRVIGGSSPSDAMMALHPPEVNGQVVKEGQQIKVYHNQEHTENVARAAYDLTLARAKAEGLPPADKAVFGSAEEKAKFMGQVGILHDADPARAPGAPARVAATLAWMKSEEGIRFMKERFGWDASTSGGKLKIAMAEAMIQRTEFPFNSATKKVPTWPKDSPAAADAIKAHYADKSPVELYTDRLKGIAALSPDALQVVMREAPFFSEYADKSSWYFGDPKAALDTVSGLGNETKSVLPPGVPVPDFLGTTRANFLDTIGREGSFAEDVRIAGQLNAPKPDVPGRDKILGMLPPDKRANWEKTNEMFGLVEAYGKKWESGAPAEPEAKTRYESVLSNEPAKREGQLKFLKDLRSKNLSNEAAAEEIAKFVSGKADKGGPPPSGGGRPPPAAADEVTKPMPPPSALKQDEITKPMAAKPQEQQPQYGTAAPGQKPEQRIALEAQRLRYAKAATTLERELIPANAKERSLDQNAVERYARAGREKRASGKQVSGLEQAAMDYQEIPKQYGAQKLRPGKTDEISAAHLDQIAKSNARRAGRKEPGEADYNEAAKALAVSQDAMRPTVDRLAKQYAESPVAKTPSDQPFLDAIAQEMKADPKISREEASRRVVEETYAEAGKLLNMQGPVPRPGESLDVFSYMLAHSYADAAGRMLPITEDFARASLAKRRISDIESGRLKPSPADKPLMNIRAQMKAGRFAGARMAADAFAEGKPLAAPPKVGGLAKKAKAEKVAGMFLDDERYPGLRGRETRADVFMGLEPGMQDAVIGNLRKKAQKGEQRVEALKAEIDKIAEDIVRLRREGKTKEADKLASKINEKNETLTEAKKDYETASSRARYLDELKLLSGERGYEIERIYGLPPGDLAKAYRRAGDAKSAQSLMGRLGINLNVDPKILPDIMGMMIGGDMLNLIAQKYNGGHVTDIEFKFGAEGAFKVTVREPNGAEHVEYAKRLDLRPDAGGTEYALRSGMPAPDVMTTMLRDGRTVDLTYTNGNGEVSRYGLLRSIGEFEGKLKIGEKERTVRAVGETAISDMMRNPEFMQEYMKDPKAFWSEYWFAVTAEYVTGNHDGHEVNTRRIKLEIMDSLSAGEVQKLKDQGYKITTEKVKATPEALAAYDKAGIKIQVDADGNYTRNTLVKNGRIDNDAGASYLAVADGKGGFNLDSMKWKFGSNDQHRLFKDIAMQKNLQMVKDKAGEWTFEVDPITGDKWRTQYSAFATVSESGGRWFVKTKDLNAATGLYFQGFALDMVGLKKATVHDIIAESRAGNALENGVRMWMRDIGSDPKYQEGMIAEFRRREGEPVGMGIRISDPGKLAEIANSGMTKDPWELQFNGEPVRPISRPDGRSTMRPEYEGFAWNTIDAQGQKALGRIFPDGKEVFIVELSSASEIPKTRLKGSPVATINGKYFAVFPSREGIPQNLAGRKAVSVKRNGDFVRTEAGFREMTGIAANDLGAVPIFKQLMDPKKTDMVKEIMDISRDMQTFEEQQSGKPAAPPKSSSGIRLGSGDFVSETPTVVKPAPPSQGGASKTPKLTLSDVASTLVKPLPSEDRQTVVKPLKAPTKDETPTLVMEKKPSEPKRGGGTEPIHTGDIIDSVAVKRPPPPPKESTPPFEVRTGDLEPSSGKGPEKKPSEPQKKSSEPLIIIEEGEFIELDTGGRPKVSQTKVDGVQDSLEKAAGIRPADGAGRAAADADLAKLPDWRFDLAAKREMFMNRLKLADPQERRAVAEALAQGVKPDDAFRVMAEKNLPKTRQALEALEKRLNQIEANGYEGNIEKQRRVAELKSVYPTIEAALEFMKIPELRERILSRWESAQAARAEDESRYLAARAQAAPLPQNKINYETLGGIGDIAKRKGTTPVEVKKAYGLEEGKAVTEDQLRSARKDALKAVGIEVNDPNQAVFDLVFKADAESNIRGIMVDGKPAYPDATIKRIEVLGGGTGAFRVEMEVLTPAGKEKRTIILKKVNGQADQIGAGAVKEAGLAPQKVHATDAKGKVFSYETGVLYEHPKGITKREVAEYEFVEDIHDYARPDASGKKPEVTIRIDGKMQSVAVEEVRLLRDEALHDVAISRRMDELDSTMNQAGFEMYMRTPEGREDILALWGKGNDAATVRFTELMKTPEGREHLLKLKRGEDRLVTEMGRLMSTPEGRKELMKRWAEYQETARLGLLSDRFARNTAAFLVKKGDTLTITFQPIDTDGVGFRIFDRMDKANNTTKTDFTFFDEDFANGTVNLLKLLSGAARGKVEYKTLVSEMREVWAERRGADNVPPLPELVQRAAKVKSYLTDPAQDGKPLGLADTKMREHGFKPGDIRIDGAAGLFLIDTQHAQLRLDKGYRDKIGKMVDQLVDPKNRRVFVDKQLTALDTELGVAPPPRPGPPPLPKASDQIARPPPLPQKAAPPKEMSISGYQAKVKVLGEDRAAEAKFIEEHFKVGAGNKPPDERALDNALIVMGDRADTRAGVNGNLQDAFAGKPAANTIRTPDGRMVRAKILTAYYDPKTSRIVSFEGTAPPGMRSFLAMVEIVGQSEGRLWVKETLAPGQAANPHLEALNGMKVPLKSGGGGPGGGNPPPLPRGPEERPAVKLTAIGGGKDSKVVAEADKAVQNISDPARLTEFLRKLNSSEPQVRSAAQAELDKMRQAGHPAAGIIDGLMGRRNVKRAFEIGDQVGIARFQKNDAPGIVEKIKGPAPEPMAMAVGDSVRAMKDNVVPKGNQPLNAPGEQRETVGPIAPGEVKVRPGGEIGKDSALKMGLIMDKGKPANTNVIDAYSAGFEKSDLFAGMIKTKKDQIIRALSIMRLAQVRASEKYGKEIKIFLVGGSVRDLAMGKMPNDMDIIVSGGEILFYSELKKAYQEAGGKDVVIRKAGLKLSDEPGGYAPDVKLVKEVKPGGKERSSLLEIRLLWGPGKFYEREGPNIPEILRVDANARDLTINSMYIELGKMERAGIIDPTGSGMKDINDNVVRFNSRTKEMLRVIIGGGESSVNTIYRLFRAYDMAGRSGAVIEPETKLLIKQVLEASATNPALRTNVEIAFSRALREGTTKTPRILKGLIEDGLMDKIPKVKGTVNPVLREISYGDLLALGEFIDGKKTAADLKAQVDRSAFGGALFDVLTKKGVGRDGEPGVIGLLRDGKLDMDSAVEFLSRVNVKDAKLTRVVIEALKDRLAPADERLSLMEGISSALDPIEILQVENSSLALAKQAISEGRIKPEEFEAEKARIKKELFARLLTPVEE